MGKQRTISASEIGEYTYCPRAWALKKLGYENDNQWELKDGVKIHEETGVQEIRKNAANQPIIEHRERQIQVLTKMIIFVFVCILLIITRIILE